MNHWQKGLVLLLLLLGSAIFISACEATSKVADRTIQNLEDEVGGAAERSRQRAGDKAGGVICGSAVLPAFAMVAPPVLFTFRAAGDRRRNSTGGSSSSREFPKKQEDKKEQLDGL